MGLIQSKKGGLLDSYIVIPIFLFIFGFTSILAFYIWGAFVDAFTTTGIYTGQVAATGGKFTGVFMIFDSITVFIMIALILGIAVTSYRIKVPAIYFIVMLIMGIFLGLVSYFFNFIFSQLVSVSQFDAVRVYFAKTILICTNLHWVMLIAIIVGSILTYSKKVEFNEGVGGI